MLRYTKAALSLIPRFIKDYCFAIARFAKHPEKYSFEKRYKTLRRIVKSFSKRLGVVIDVSGLEKLPKDMKYLMVGNHTSVFDPFPIIALMEEGTSFISKIEAEKYFAVGNAIKSVDGLFLDRQNLKQQLKVMLKVQNDLKEQNKNWLIFPEGTRNEDPLSLIKEFHPGTFRPAVKSEVPIIPIAIYGTHRVLKFLPQFKKYVVSVSILDPIYPNEYKDLSNEDIANRCKDAIQKELSFSLRQRNTTLMKKYNNKKFSYYL